MSIHSHTVPRSRLTDYPPMVRLAGVLFDNVTMGEAIARIDAFVRQRQPRMVVTPNLDHVIRIRRNRDYANVVSQADMILVDSQPLVKLSRWLGKPFKERVAGSDLFPRLCAHCARAGYRVFLLGGDPGAAICAAETLTSRYPGLIVEAYCPPYGFESNPEENRKALDAVCKARPDILFVGLGSPKQEYWIAKHMPIYRAPVSVGVGISFSFVAGTVKRAPVWMRSAGLEWLHRLACEPRRLWRRYLVESFGFLPLLYHELRHPSTVWADAELEKLSASEASLNRRGGVPPFRRDSLGLANDPTSSASTDAGPRPDEPKRPRVFHA